MLRQGKVVWLVVGLVTLLFALSQAQAQSGITGTITTKKADGKVEPLPDVDVIVGKDIWVESTPAGDFVRNAKNIVARTKTDSKGNFKLDVKPGQYTIILWKREFVPVKGSVTAPGRYNNNLSHKKGVSNYPHTSLSMKDN